MDDRLDRRTFLACGAALTASLAGCPSASDDGQATETSDGGQATETFDVELGATAVASGFGSPTDVVTLDGGGLLVAEQRGQVVHATGGDVGPVLDLRDSVVDLGGYSEQGLLGVEPHPDFATNGRLFVRYSAPPRDGTPDGYSHTFVLAEFVADPTTLSIDPDSERPILEIPEPQSNHNAGPLAFGPDGLLYVPVGDGGGANDQGQGHVDDWFDPIPGGNGQDTTENLLGSLLRIDVDSESGDRPYGIPDDNPLVGAEGLDEHYAWGFRNPWGLSFGPDGRLFVADVGQDSYEEVNVVERGGNYGWNVREGPTCFVEMSCPNVTPSGEQLRDPIVSYPHDGGTISGNAVVGGHRYDGAGVPALQGAYVFGDWTWDGRLFVAREGTDGSWSTEVAPVVEGRPEGNLQTIGRDAEGELLLGTTTGGADSESGGAISRVTSV